MGPDTILWNDGNSDLQRVFGAGSYSCQITDANGCKADTSFVIATITSECVPNVFTPNSDGTNDHSSNGGAINISGPSYYDQGQQLWIGSQVQIINSTFANNLTKSGNTSSTRLSGSGLYLDSWGRSEKIWFFIKRSYKKCNNTNNSS